MVDLILDEFFGEESQSVPSGASSKTVDVHVRGAFDGHREDVEDVETGVDGKLLEVLAVKSKHLGDVLELTLTSETDLWKLLPEFFPSGEMEVSELLRSLLGSEATITIMISVGGVNVVGVIQC